MGIPSRFQVTSAPPGLSYPTVKVAEPRSSTVTGTGWSEIRGASGFNPQATKASSGIGPSSTPSGRTHRTARLSPPPSSFCRASM